MPRLPLLFAKRYLFSRKSLSVINIISVVSAATVAVPVMAMVVLLSVFNGFDTLVKTMYRNFDPDIQVTAASGRFFDSDSLSLETLGAVRGVEKAGYIVEENALIELDGRQAIGTIRGVDSLFSEIVPIETMVARGEFRPKLGDLNQALVGQGMAYNLMLRGSMSDPIEVYVPRRGAPSALLPVDLYRKRSIFASGIFSLDNETDGKYVIVPIDFARDVLDLAPGKVSAAIIKLSPNADPGKVRREIAAAAGEKFKVQTRYQQKESLYRIMQYEKWGIYFIILMVLVIASFSIVGSLVMIIIDKDKDTQTLVTLGANRKLIRAIFMSEGMLISGIGAAVGIVAGILICVMQQKFGFVKMAGESFMIDAYPVEIRISDIIGVVFSVSAINFIISWFTVTRLMGKRETTS